MKPAEGSAAASLATAKGTTWQQASSRIARPTSERSRRIPGPLVRQQACKSSTRPDPLQACACQDHIDPPVEWAACLPELAFDATSAKWEESRWIRSERFIKSKSKGQWSAKSPAGRLQAACVHSTPPWLGQHAWSPARQCRPHVSGQLFLHAASCFLSHLHRYLHVFQRSSPCVDMHVAAHVTGFQVPGDLNVEGSCNKQNSRVLPAVLVLHRISRDYKQTAVLLLKTAATMELRKDR